MKKFFFISLFIMITDGYSQHPFSGVVEYTIEATEPFKAININNDKNLDEAKKKELIEILTKPAYFILEFTSSESLYKSKVNNMNSDSEKRPKLNFMQTFGGGALGVYYSNSNKKKTLAQKNAFGELLLISYEIQNWELTKETKKIGSFLCYKAIKKSKNQNSKTIEEVWYTSEIPVQFGPALYNGLPGLVLEVQVGKIRIIATKVSLNTDQSKIIIIEEPNQGIKMTEEEYLKKINEIADEFGF